MAERKEDKRKEAGNDNECCDIKVTKTEDGMRIDVKGMDCAEFMGQCFSNCCSKK